MSDVQFLGVCVVLVGLAWAYVWDQKNKRDDRLYRERMQQEGRTMGAVNDAMRNQLEMVRTMRKPPTVPGDEWKQDAE